MTIASRPALVLAMNLLLAACGSSPGSSSAPKCIPGSSDACTCTDGRTGAQTCDASGSFGSCVCTSGGGASTGAGGSAPSPDAGSGGGDPASCTDLPINFIQDTTLAKGCYLARATPSLAEGATLLLSPGVRIIFSQDTSLTLRHSQTLVAQGTAADPIVLTGAQKSRGFWKGVVFDQTDTQGNELTHVTIEYAGGPTAGGTLSFSPSALVTIGDLTLLVENTTLQESAGYGFYFDPYGAVAFHDNVVTRNAETGWLELIPNRILDPSNQYSGNDRDRLTLGAVGGGSTLSIPIPLLDVPYYFPHAVTSSAMLRPAAGTRFIFGVNSGLTMDIFGTLEAVGTTDKPIVFTGEQAMPGFWRGITITSTASNIFDHAIVEYGGGGDVDGANVKFGATSLGALHTVVRSTLQHSAHWGLWAGALTALNADYATSNTYIDNVSGDTFRAP